MPVKNYSFYNFRLHKECVIPSVHGSHTSYRQYQYDIGMIMSSMSYERQHRSYSDDNGPNRALWPSISGSMLWDFLFTSIQEYIHAIRTSFRLQRFTS